MTMEVDEVAMVEAQGTEAAGLVAGMAGMARMAVADVATGGGGEKTAVAAQVMAQAGAGVRAMADAMDSERGEEVKVEEVVEGLEALKEVEGFEVVQEQRAATGEEETVAVVDRQAPVVGRLVVDEEVVDSQVAGMEVERSKQHIRGTHRSCNTLLRPLHEIRTSLYRLVVAAAATSVAALTEGMEA